MDKASTCTCQKNKQLGTMLPFDHNHELDLAKQNCVASFNQLEIKQGEKVIWSQKAYEFLETECPDSANPSLWENARCNHQTGLFRVTDKIFQLRGFDMANLTLILTPKNNWLVFDTLMSIECSRAAMEFANQWFEKNRYPIVDGHISGIIISHSHVDHFGGLRGLFPDFTLDPTIPIFAPAGFTEAAITENLMSGKAMGRRASYQYGTLLEKSPAGSLSIGIGQGQSLGTVSFELPTKEITTNETIVVDGLELIFQLTPGTEAPAEMNTFFPQYDALWMAENCTCTMHKRILCKKALTQLGYQSESGTWRNEYLTGALELSQGTLKDPNYYANSSPDLIDHLTGEMVLNYLSILTIPTEKHLFGTILFEDDWAFESGSYRQQTSCYHLDYWQGILTYYPISSDGIASTNHLYRGKRMAFMNQLLNIPSDDLKEWNLLFETNPDERYFNIIEP